MDKNKENHEFNECRFEGNAEVDLNFDTWNGNESLDDSKSIITEATLGSSSYVDWNEKFSLKI